MNVEKHYELISEAALSFKFWHERFIYLSEIEHRSINAKAAERKKLKDEVVQASKELDVARKELFRLAAKFETERAILAASVVKKMKGEDDGQYSKIEE